MKNPFWPGENGKRKHPLERAIVLGLGIWLMFMGATHTLRAQTDRGTITGVVTDTSGAVVVGASVTATNTGTGITTQVSTSAAGSYTFPALQLGVYRVTAEQQGFKQFVREGIVVEVAQTVRVDATMEVGAVTEKVEVKGASPLLQPETSDLGTVVTHTFVQDLPLPQTGEARNPLNFIGLAPGVKAIGTSAAAKEFGFDVGPGGTSINGGQAFQAEIQVDGASLITSDLAGDFRNMPLPIDVVQEFKLQTNNMSAESGRAGNGIINFVLRSGTNNFHGSGYEFLRNEALDARGFFVPNRSVERQNEFGVTVGGPVVIPHVYNGSNRTFFFAYYNGFRYNTGATNQLTTIPTVAMQHGDFSGLVDPTGKVIPIYDPATTQPDGSGGFTRDQFPGNIIPTNRQSAVAQKIAALFPAPLFPGLVNNYFAHEGPRTSWKRWGLKLDHEFSAKNRINGSFILADTADHALPFISPLPGPLSTAQIGSHPERLFRLSDDYVFRPNLINHVQVGYNRDSFLSTSVTHGQGWPAKLGLVNIPANAPFPYFSFTGTGVGGYDNFGSANEGGEIGNAYVFLDTLTWVKGRHTLKLGVNFSRSGINLPPFADQVGYYFASAQTELPNSPNPSLTGNPWASFMVGAVAQSSLPITKAAIADRYAYYSTFVQDDFKVTPKLTLNLGLRYEVPIPRGEAHNNMSAFDFLLPNPGAGGRLGALAFAGSGPGRTGRRSFADTDHKEFGPRFGLAYRINDKTVFRGGYGLFYGLGGALTDNGSRPHFSAGFNANDVVTSPDSFSPAMNLDSPWPIGQFPTPPFIDPTFVNNNDTAWMPKDSGRASYVGNWNAGIQRQLPWAILLEATYAGSKGTRLNSHLTIPNQVDPKYLSLGATLNADINSPQAIAAGIQSPYPGFTGSVAQALRPYPQVHNIFTPYDNVGASTYNAFQLKLEKRFTSGLGFLVAYTASRTYTNAETSMNAFFASGAQDTFNKKAEWSLSGQDIPQTLVLSYSYELPVGPGKPFLKGGGVVGKVVGGWQVTGIQTYYGSYPMNIQASNTLPIFDGQLRANVVAGQNPRAPISGKFDPAVDVYINPAAFSAPAPYTFGNAPRTLGNLRGFPFLNEDIGIIKRTSITERVNLEFRSEFFNIFNRVVFNGPSTNVSDVNSFGRVGSQFYSPRIIQFGMKLNF